MMMQRLPEMMRPPHVYDLFGVIGLALGTFGLWEVWPPLALIAIGLVLMGVALRGAMTHGDDDERRTHRHRRRRRKIDYTIGRNERGEEAVVARPVIEKGYLCSEDEF